MGRALLRHRVTARRSPAPTRAAAASLRPAAGRVDGRPDRPRRAVGGGRKIA
ncbi:hypothetical protein KCH_39220 [Kitasatospora cheerisanensis KCTC 2395]|uniref:Uncharacterized protein n=1 Tax=Kitasatospora cheerisanensis KCTC 2395 TaxID=1348663 RepID=A0A066Z1D0_9ACTN|nr:hypothetical protein KCH_39220 [Kitasatospora cheerisanensis KCTC 2395]